MNGEMKERKEKKREKEGKKGVEVIKREGWGVERKKNAIHITNLALEVEPGFSFLTNNQFVSLHLLCGRREAGLKVRIEKILVKS